MAVDDLQKAIIKNGMDAFNFFHHQYGH